MTPRTLDDLPAFREWLDLKFKYLENKIDNLVANKTEEIKENRERIEQLRRDCEKKFRKTIQYLIIVFILGSFIWIKESRDFIIDHVFNLL